MDPHRISASPTKGNVEIWHLIGGTGWAHPIHIHFEEGKILARGGAAPPLWEAGARKDVFRLSTFPDSTNNVDVALRFREFMGSYVEHCHNTQHEDNAMLMRWDLKNPGSAVAIPTPVQTWEGTFYEPSFGPNSGP
jgi:manganese oxidase